jgi:hypothetical protein
VIRTVERRGPSVGHDTWRRGLFLNFREKTEPAASRPRETPAHGTAGICEGGPHAET